MSHIASRKQFSRNMVSGWMLFAAEVGVAFVLTPYIIHKLGAAAYGVWALMIGVIGYMGLVDLGIRGSVGRYINHYLALGDRRALSQVVGVANVVLTALSLLVLLAALMLGDNFLLVFPKTPPELAGAVRFCMPLLALGLWLSFIGSILGNLLAAKEAIYLTNLLGLVLLVVRTVAVVWALGAGFGIEALVLATVAVSSLGLALSGWIAKRLWGADMPRLVGFSLSRLKEIWRFGVASFAGRTAATMANDSAPIIGMWLLGPEAVAVYSVAMTLTQYARRLIEQAGNAIFPSVMKAGAIKDYAGLRAVYLRYMNVSFALGSLMFIGLMVFSHSFLGLWVGPQYQAGAWVVAILAFGYLMQGVASTAPLTLASLDRVNVTMWIGIGEAIACVVLTAALPGLFGWGLAGMALGATLPRLATNCILYPRLAVSTMGAELRPAMISRIARNLALSAGAAAAFAGIYLVLPGTTWPSLVAAVALMTLLHVAVLGHRYEVAGVGWLHDSLQTVALRFQKGRST